MDLSESQRHHLRLYKYLRVKPNRVRTSHLQFIFMGFATFAIGILIGFNFNDVMRRNCCNNNTPSKRTVTERQPVTRIVDQQQQILTKSDQKDEQPKPTKEVFTKLPEKFLNNTPMGSPANFYNLRPWKIEGEIENNQNFGKYFAIVLVKTAAFYTKRRFEIRLTWGSMKVIEGKRMAVVFIVGVPRSRHQQKMLDEENALYGDLIQGDVPDTYKQLPRKVLSGYQFISEYMGDVSEYYISTDDDCFLNIPNTYDYFRQLDPSKKDALHCGYIYSSKSSRITNPKSKWRIEDEVYPLKAYPKFCHGGMTVLSFNMLRGIYKMSLVTNYTGFHLEDVLTNGILREKLSTPIDDIYPIYYRDAHTRKRLPLMWHLGYRKDRDRAFLGIWRGIRRRLTYYEGPFDVVKGFRSKLSSLETLEGKSVKETILHFCPEEEKSPNGFFDADVKKVGESHISVNITKNDTKVQQSR